MSAEQGNTNITFFRHGNGMYNESGVQFPPGDPFSDEYNPYWKQADSLTKDGVEQVRKSVTNLIKTIDPNEKIYIIASATGRTIETAEIIDVMLQSYGYTIGGKAITEELGEPKGFVWKEFFPLISGGKLRIGKKTVRFNVDETNSDRLDHRSYFMSQAWKKIPKHVRHSWPKELESRYQAIETYPETSKRILNFIDRIKNISTSGANKRFIIVTHEASALFFSKVAHQGKGIGLPEGGFLNLAVNANGTVYINNYNSEPIKNFENLDDQIDKEFISIIQEPSRDDIWNALRQESLISTIYAATNLSTIYNPPFKWIVATDGSSMGILGLYKNYRLFPFGDPKLTARVIAWIQRHPEYLKSDLPQGLSEKLTIVSPESSLLLPSGYELEKQPVGYKRFLLHTQDLRKPLRHMPGKIWVHYLNESDVGNIKTLLTPTDGSNPNVFTEEVYFDEKRLLGGLPYIGAFEGSNLIGIVGTHGLVPDKSIAAIGDAFVLPKYRRFGIAENLTHALIQHLRDKHHVNHIGTDMRDDKPGYLFLTNIGFTIWNKKIYYSECKKLE